MLFFSSRQLSRVRVNFTSGSSTTSGLQMFSFILSKVNSWIKFLTLHAVWFYYYNSLYSQREANFQSILILNHPWPFILESAICLDISYIIGLLCFFSAQIILFPFQLKNLWLTDHVIRKEDLAIHISGSVWFRKLMREYDNHPSNAGPIIRFTMNILSSRWHLMKWKSGHWFSRFLTMISFPAIKQWEKSVSILVKLTWQIV